MRKIYLIKHALQFRYLKLLLISIILPALFVGSCLYYVIFTILAEDLGIPEVISAHLIPVVKRIDGVLLVGLPIIIVFLASWGLILSNRLAGPIARVEREMAGIIEGKFSQRIQVRKDDDLNSIVRGINTLLDKIEQLQKSRR